MEICIQIQRKPKIKTLKEAKAKTKTKKKSYRETNITHKLDFFSETMKAAGEFCEIWY